MSLLAATRRGVSWTTASVAACALGGVVQLAIAARFLSREELGHMGLVLLLVGAASQLSDLGTAKAVLHRQRAPRGEIESLHCLSAATGLALFVLGCGSGPILARVFDEPGFVRWLPLASADLLLAGWLQVPLALLQRELRFRSIALVEVSGAVASLVTVAVLVTSGFGVAALLLGQIASTACRLLVSLAASRSLFRPRLRFSAEEVRPYLAFGIYQVGERMLNFAAWNLDKAVIAAWLGPEALGAYYLAYRLMIRPFGFIAGVSSNVAHSVLARMKGDRERLVRGYLMSVRLAALIAFPLYVGAFFTAESLVTLLYGPGWDDVAALFTILCPLGALYAIGNPVGGVVVATGRARASFLWNLFAVAVSLTAVLLGAPHGARGVATALLLATAGILFPCGFFLRWVLVRLPPGPFLACLGRPLVYALIMGVAVEGLTILTSPLTPALRLAFAVACGGAVYAALIWKREQTLLLAIRGVEA